jgi:hypothetical protein
MGWGGWWNFYCFIVKLIEAEKYIKKRKIFGVKKRTYKKIFEL